MEKGKEKTREEFQQLYKKVAEQLNGLRVDEAVVVLDHVKSTIINHSVIDIEHYPYL
jgi:hypothetical protein